MNVSLTVELETWVQERVRSGLYQSASEVVRESLRLLRERELQRQRVLDELRGEVAVGVEQLDRGACRELTRAFIAELKRSGRGTMGTGSRLTP